MALSKGMVKNAATTPLDVRQSDAGLIVANADGSPRLGVLASLPSIVKTTATTAPMTVTVDPAPFVLSKGLADGVTLPANVGIASVTIPAAPGANSRIDSVWVKHNDDTTGDANALPVFGVTSGAAAASPTAPAIPTGALRLANLQIYAGTTSTAGGANVLTNVYGMTAMSGGLVPFRSAADLTAWSAQDGCYAIDLATGDLYARILGAWVGGPIAQTVITLGSGMGWRTGGQILRDGRQVTLNLAMTRTARLVGNAGEILGTMPPGLRPATDVQIPVYIISGVGRGFGYININPAGTMSVFNFVASETSTGTVTIGVTGVYLLP